jgi:hypothetical protein
VRSPQVAALIVTTIMIGDRNCSLTVKVRANIRMDKEFRLPGSMEDSSLITRYATVSP